MKKFLPENVKLQNIQRINESKISQNGYINSHNIKENMWWMFARVGKYYF